MNDETNSNEPLITRRQVIQGAGSVVASAAASGSATTVAAATTANVMPTGPAGTTVIQYVLGRLKDLGVTHTFGVPGDFIYDVCDAIQDDPDIKGLWCANEMNAGYCADGYARTNGVGVVVVTMAAEMCTFHSMAGAHAERAKVVHLFGFPSDGEVASGHRLHHMVGNMAPDRHDMWHQMAKPITAGEDGVAIMTPENCVYETERLIAAMMYHSLPISMHFPRLTAHQPVIWPTKELNIPLANPTSDPDALDAAAREILYRFDKSKQPAFLPGYLLRRYNCVDEALALIQASGAPWFTGLQDQAVLSEQHPQFGGLYVGQWSEIGDPDVTNYVDSSDCIIGLAPEDHSFNTGFHTTDIDVVETVNIMPHKVRIGKAVYENVEMVDLIVELTRRIEKRTGLPEWPAYNGLLGTNIDGAPGDDITHDLFNQRFQAFLRPNDIIVADTSVASIFAVARSKMPEGVEIEGQTSLGGIGWGTPVVIGNKVAAPDRRAIIVAGEGGHQMTANELGLCGRYDIKPIFLVVNNDGYLAERLTNRYPDEDYNSLAQWDYAKLPGVMGCKDWFTAKVTNLGELDAAMAKASDADVGVYIEIIIDRDDIPTGANWMFNVTGDYFGLGGRNWVQWLEHGRDLKI